MTRFLYLLPVALLVACDAPSPTTPIRPTLPAPDEDTCGAAAYADLIGQDATALETVLIMRPVRVIRPGTAITMDFRQDRLNFQIDWANTIASIGCY